MYLSIKPGESPPALAAEPSRVIVVLDTEVSPEWQSTVSEWLVSVGCLYMLAWGARCSSWDDSVDHANLEAVGFEAIPEGADVMTTWHENESLQEVMWFAKSCAFHSSVDLTRTIILHVGESPREQELCAIYAAA
ncbi:DUF7684 family protein [Pseudomarimonas salicorniae]|uniref:DUF7684 family protein n=1 Tax=Pseudomarimonas salicorniae TaxID=2933270 RepID=UPI003CCD01B1